MSYDIYIGNAVVKSAWTGGGEYEDEPFAEWVVEPLELPGAAPFKDDATGYGNHCHPGYHQWDQAMRSCGLHTLWFGNDPIERSGLLKSHPGITPLTPGHLAIVETAYQSYCAKHPDAKPGGCSCKACEPWQSDPDVPHDPQADFNLVRFDWMLFWMRWALANCERPAVYNH